MTESHRNWPGQNRVVVFFIATEHPIALPEGVTVWAPRPELEVPWARVLGGIGFVGIRVWRRPEVIEWNRQRDDNAFAVADLLCTPTGNTLPDDRERVPPPHGEQLGSVVELATPLIVPEGVEEGQAVSDAFDRCLEELQTFMRAYGAVTRDPRFRSTTRQTCRVAVPMTMQHPVTNEYGYLQTFHVNWGAGGTLPYPPEELDERDQLLFGIRFHRALLGDPLTPYLERARVAQRSYLIDGDYPTTVVATYTAAEVLLNGLLLLMAWEEGLARDDTLPWFAARTEYLSRVGGQVVPRLGGNWSSPPTTGMMGRLRDLSDARNRIVHRADLPNEPAAKEALATGKALETMVKQRLAERRLAYPKTCMLFLGVPGLEKLYRLDGRMRRWIERHGEYRPEWIIDYVAWRDSVPAGRVGHPPPQRTMTGRVRPYDYFRGRRPRGAGRPRRSATRRHHGAVDGATVEV